MKVPSHTPKQGNFLHFRVEKRILNDKSYESVKPLSFMTIPTSHTSYRRNQVKSTNHGKTYISVLKYRTKHLVVTIGVKRREEPNLGSF